MHHSFSFVLAAGVPAGSTSISWRKLSRITITQKGTKKESRKGTKKKLTLGKHLFRRLVCGGSKHSFLCLLCLFVALNKSPQAARQSFAA